MRRLATRLDQQRLKNFIGREREIKYLQKFALADAPIVTYLHGLSGIGKSALLHVFCDRAKRAGLAVHYLDCRQCEPTESGFVWLLGAALGTPVRDLEAAITALSDVRRRVILALDHYEALFLLDTWIRQEFVPALSDQIRVLIAGRYPPSPGWQMASEWQGLFRSQLLTPLSDGQTVTMLERSGVAKSAALRIRQFTGGHPLAIKLAAAAWSERPGLDLVEETAQHVVHNLAQIYLSDLGDTWSRKAVEAAAVVRRVTRSMLASLLPGAPAKLFDHLPQLPLIESRSDGLTVHDAVRDAIASNLRATDPASYRGYRRAAWHQLRREMHGAERSALWRYTADMIYLVEDAHVREAFFPKQSHRFFVEPLAPEDIAQVRAISWEHESSASAAVTEFWLNKYPEVFRVVRDSTGEVHGFYAMLERDRVVEGDLSRDPIVAKWYEHLQKDKIGKRQKILFVRRWLSHDVGELPSEVQAACWLDIKRTYLELRPNLRRVYVAVGALAKYDQALKTLRFRALPDCAVTLGGQVYQSAVLDFGSSSIDGWFSDLVAAQVGDDEDFALDTNSRELTINGRRVNLTKLEFELLRYLHSNPDKALSRDTLLDDVWGQSYHGGSNVVDVVIRSLRQKLGSRSAAIETVRGTGYRFKTC